jgi:FkbM family methyltransferase
MLFDFLKEGDLVFDVGCNVGKKADIFLSKKCKVIGFEPQKTCFDMLSKKYENNPSIVLESLGLGSEDKEVEFYIASADTISSMSPEFIVETKKNRFSTYSWHRKEIVKVTTLDAMIEKHGQPAFCKIDVEGYESEVLKGLNKYTIPMLSMEFTPEIKKNSLECVDKLLSLNRNYRFNIVNGENEHFRFNEWLDEGYIKKAISEINFPEWGDIYAKL